MEKKHYFSPKVTVTEILQDCITTSALTDGVEKVVNFNEGWLT